MQPEKVRIASEEVRANYIKTVILLLMMAGCIIALSWLLGFMLLDEVLGLQIGLVVALVVIPFELLCAKFAVLQLTGCVRARPEDPQQRRIIQLVEGLSIAAGLPKTPKVYIMRSNVPNAFAAGWGPNSAVVAVTQGLADMMDDQELEGVIAHEIAHIVHRDVMVCQVAAAAQTAMMILAQIIKCVGYLVMWFASSRDEDDERGGSLGSLGAVLVGLLLSLFIEPLTWLISTLMVMAISRKREYAADAFAVRLCAYNEGLARALEKLSDDCPRYNSKVAHDMGGNTVGPMYFYFPVRSLFSTHPDTAERIRRLRNMY